MFKNLNPIIFLSVSLSLMLTIQFLISGMLNIYDIYDIRCVLIFSIFNNTENHKIV